MNGNNPTSACARRRAHYFEAMPLPSYETFMLPILRAVDRSNPAAISNVMATVAHDLNLTDDAKTARFTWSPQTVLEARVERATQDLATAGLVTHREGQLRMTARGTSVLSDAPAAIDRRYLEQFPEYRDYREAFLRRRGA